jgi:hypothetical protein
MDLSKILAISGKPGLYEVVSQSKTGLIVESLTDGKRIPVFASHQSSALEDISMFTYGDDVPLKEVFWKIHEKENGKPSIDPKSSADKLKEYFETILPDYDKERVYPSDIKKLLSWYNLLLDKGMITEPEQEESSEAAADVSEEKPADTSSESEKEDTPKKSKPAKGKTKKEE